MTTVIDANLIPLIIALVIGFIIGWWMFKRSRSRRESVLSKDPGPSRVEAEAVEPAAPVRPYMRNRPIRDGVDTIETKAAPAPGRGLADEGAAAVNDVAGEVLGVQAETRAPAEMPSDDFQMLKGVGPKLAQKLAENGLTRFEQLAALTPNEVSILDAKLGAFRGRLERDRVVEQASYLARGDRDGFEARFGKLGNA